jgi:hypothetical protein
MRRTTVAVLMAVAVLVAIPGAASADPTFTGTANTPEGKLNVSVNVKKFTATAAGTQASGTATATLTPLAGTPVTVKKRLPSRLRRLAPAPS